MLLYAEACTYPQRHRPKDLHKDIRGQTHLHPQRLAQTHERSVWSRAHVQKHRDVHGDARMCTQAGRYTDPHPHRIMKRWLQQLEQTQAEAHVQISTHAGLLHGCTDRHGGAQTDP